MAEVSMTAQEVEALLAEWGWVRNDVQERWYAPGSTHVAILFSDVPKALAAGEEELLELVFAVTARGTKVRP